MFGEGTINGIVEKNDIIKYTVKLPFGLAHLSPSAILYNIQDNTAPFVRRDGSMVSDEATERSNVVGATLSDKYQLLFGTENVYLFLRRFSLLCQLLSSIREHCETVEPPEDPALSYATKLSQQQATEPMPSEQLGFSAIIATLGKVMTKDVTALEYESLCRKISKEKVHLMAALPKLIERCTECLVRAAQEDVLLYLYDHCQLPQVDPVSVRANCFSSAPDASFRIQYDTSTETFFFSYLPRDAELHLSPQAEPMEEDETVEATATDDAESDPIEEYESDDVREAKRPRIAL